MSTFTIVWLSHWPPSCGWHVTSLQLLGTTLTSLPIRSTHFHSKANLPENSSWFGKWGQKLKPEGTALWRQSFRGSQGSFSSWCISSSQWDTYIHTPQHWHFWRHQIYTKQQGIFVQTKVNIENAAFCFDRGCPRPPFWFQTLKGCPRPAPISQLCI